MARAEVKNGGGNWEAALWAEQLGGPVQKLRAWLEDPLVTDILIHGTQAAFVERAGELAAVPVPFTSAEEFAAVIERLTTPLHTGIDAARPYLDGRLSTGARFHLILPPIAIQGPYLSIRKFSTHRLRPDDFGSCVAVEWVRAAVVSKKNILIAGATGTGKTSLLAALLAEVPMQERVVVLEETRELPIDGLHFAFLEARVANADGRGAVTLHDLLRNALRMRPDRLVVGECRGEEALDLLQALSTGHAGSLATIHASSAMGALSRLEALTLLARPNLTTPVARRWIAGAIQYVVHLQRRGATREICEIIELTGLDREEYVYLPVWDVRE